MILTRPGNKRRIAHDIIPHFPEHDLYIEPFFGAGGMFFSKPKAAHNIVNDYDSEVYNLFRVIIDRRDELEHFWQVMPLHEDLWKYWKANEEGDPIRKAARFLLFSNFSFMGRMATMRFDRNKGWALALRRIKDVQELMQGVLLMNSDFRQMLLRISFRENGKKGAFIYCDPPYLGTKGGNYDSFNVGDTTDLFDLLDESDCRFAVSEFDHPYLLQIAAERKLNVIQIGERQNMKNRRMEILITNYRT